MINNNGGSAFPVNQQDDRNGDTFIYAEPGMTLRDYFAAKADVSVYVPFKTFELAYSKQPTISELAQYISRIRYEEADAMLKAREVGNE